MKHSTGRPDRSPRRRANKRNARSFPRSTPSHVHQPSGSSASFQPHGLSRHGVSQHTVRSHARLSSIPHDADIVTHSFAQDSTPLLSGSVRQEQDYISEIVMSIHMTDRGCLGCAYYVSREEKLHIMEDVQLGGLECIEPLKAFIEPTVVLVSTKCEDEVMNQLDPENRNARNSARRINGDQTRLPYLLECRPQTEFKYESAREKLLALRIGSQQAPNVVFLVPGDVTSDINDFDDMDAEHGGNHGRWLRLSGQINVESRVSVGCAGVVLSFLQRRRSSAFLPGDPESATYFAIETIEMFCLKGSMFINNDTLSSLQIIQSESHPNAANQGPPAAGSSIGSKEGFSVYGLFHHFAKTPQGRRILRQFFLRPSNNLAVIKERLNSISALLYQGNADTLANVRNCLSKIKNMRTVIMSLRRGVNCGLNRNRCIVGSIWTSLRSFAYFALAIVDCLQTMHGAERLVLCNKISDKFDPHALASVGRQISEIVDFDATKEEQRTVVLPGIDPELDEIKRVYQGIEDLLNKVRYHVIQTMPSDLNLDVNVVFFPQFGFLLATPVMEGTGRGPWEGTDLDTWELLFSTQTDAYYKNYHVRELDGHFGDVHGQICDKEIEIIQDLSQRILEYANLLNEASDLCGELDALCALAEGARQYGFTRPRIRDDNVIRIQGGRHPLQERTVSQYVPNDTHLAGGSGGQLNGSETFQGLSTQDKALSQEDHRSQTMKVPPTQVPSVIVLTGPNYSGKSVYLKQVAVITFLAHIGSYVPADVAHIALTDKILTRIATRESVSRIQSAFMIDLQQVSLALSLATRRSLIILDEFGKGTQSNDGAGLVAGTFEHLLQRGDDCPKVLGATHFHEIFEHGFLAPRPGLQFAHMEVQVQPSAQQLNDQVTYLYTFRPTRSNSSFGACCAAMNGIDGRIVQRAEDLVQLMVRGADLVEACAGMSENELEELANAEHLARELLKVDTNSADLKHFLDDL